MQEKSVNHVAVPSVSQLLSMASCGVLSSVRNPRCLSPSIAILISFAVVQSGMSMHDYCIDGSAHA